MGVRGGTDVSKGTKFTRVGRKRLNPIAARKAARKAKRAGKKRSRAEHAKRRWEEPTQQPQQPSQNSKDQVLKKRSQQSKQAVRAEEQERPKKRVRFAEEVKDEEDLDITVSNDTVDDVDEEDFSDYAEELASMENVTAVSNPSADALDAEIAYLEHMLTGGAAATDGDGDQDQDQDQKYWHSQEFVDDGLHEVHDALETLAEDSGQDDSDQERLTDDDDDGVSDADDDDDHTDRIDGDRNDRTDSDGAEFDRKQNAERGDVLRNVLQDKSREHAIQQQLFGTATVSEQSTTAAAGKYVPPHLRRQSNRLASKVKGLLNRAAASNVDGISETIADLFLTGEHTRGDVTAAVCDAVLGACTRDATGGTPPLMSSAIAAPLAGLVAALHWRCAKVGSAFGSELLERVVVTLEQERAAAATNFQRSLRACQNLLSLLTFLYLLNIANAELLCHALERVAADFGAIDVELLAHCFCSYASTEQGSSSGTGSSTNGLLAWQLRRDAPLLLKSVIAAVQSAAAKARAEETGAARRAFLLDALLLVKNNDPARRKLAQSTYEAHVQPLQKTLSTMAKRIAVRPELHRLEIPLEDLLSASEKGRWWRVGAAWAGHSHRPAKKEDTADSPDADLLQAQSEEVALARTRKLKFLRTHTHRRIFLALTGSTDYVHAIQRLDTLQLRGKKDKDLAEVLLQCVAREKCYNPFYAHVGRHYASQWRGFAFSLQIAFWDMLERMRMDFASTPKTAKKVKLRASNVARLLAFLVRHKAVPLAVLRRLQLARQHPLDVLVCFVLLRDLFGFSTGSASEALDSKEISQIFRKLAGKRDAALAELRDCLALFLPQQLRPRLQKMISAGDTVSQERLERAMHAASTALSATVAQEPARTERRTRIK